MAQKSVVQYFDDIDKTPLSSNEVNTINFSVDGKDYLLEVSTANAREFYDAIQPFVTYAQKVQRSAPAARRGRRSADNSGVPTKLVREWAEAQGKEVSKRGRLPQEIVDEYKQAHGL